MDKNVKIIPAKDGAMVTAYEGNPEFGYIMLGQTSSHYENGWLRTKNSRTIMKGDVKSLTAFVSGNPTLTLPGNLVTNEYLEDAVPESVANAHFDSSKTREEQISGYIKRAGTDGPALTGVDGKRILRFVTWDQAGTAVSETISHENVEEVAAHNAEKANAEAELN